MSGQVNLALLIRAPSLHSQGERSPNTVALVAGVASAEQDSLLAIGGLGGTYGSAVNIGRYVRIVCDQDFTIAFGTTGMGAPVIGVEWPLKADNIYDLFVEPAESRYFRAISANNATLFWYLG
jgi:hypothetical protein